MVASVVRGFAARLTPLREGGGGGLRDRPYHAGVCASLKNVFRTDGARAMHHKLISGDNHIDLTYCPADLWSSQAPAKWKKTAPRVEMRNDGQHWFVGDRSEERR